MSYIVVAVDFSFASCCVFSEIHFRQLEIDKILFLPQETITVIVEPDELHSQNHWQLDDVELFATVAHPVTLRTSVRDYFRL